MSVAARGTVARALEDAARRHASRPFLRITADTAARSGIAPGDISYSQAWRRTRALIDRFGPLARHRGQRVALLLENRPDMFFNWLALNALGVSVAPLNPAWGQAELAYALEHSEARIAIAWPDRAGQLRGIARRRALNLPVCEPGEEPPGLPSPQPAWSPAANPAERECALLYTSGTTGRPKGCMLSNRYFTMIGEWYASLGGLCALDEGRDCLITPLPMHHMNALACSTMAMLRTGGCIAPLDRFHPRSWWREVGESRATIAHYLGVMPAILLKLPAAPEERGHRVRFGFGAGVGSSQHALFEQRFGFPLVEAWAMTETGAGAAIAASHEPRKRGSACFGRPQPALEARIVATGGGEAKTDEPGELWVRHAGDNPRAGFFSGYFKDAAATAAAWAGGWFHTGDIVARDAGGDLHFIDRNSNMIRRSGENISAVEVEAALAEHPAVAEAAVAAAPDELRGDEVFACVRASAGLDQPLPGDALARELVRHCLEKLAYFKAPGYVALVDELPRTATEKLDRAGLKTLVSQLLECGAAVDTRAMKRSASSRAA